MVAVIDILRIRFAGAYTAAIAAIETNRRMTPKEIIGNCHTADGKCPAIRKSYSDLLSGKMCIRDSSNIHLFKWAERNYHINCQPLNDFIKERFC